MIATHNIKVNGRWIHTGEEYGEPVEQTEMELTPVEAVTEEPEAKQEEPQEEPVQEAPKTRSRRKSTAK